MDKWTYRHLCTVKLCGRESLGVLEKNRGTLSGTIKSNRYKLPPRSSSDMLSHLLHIIPTVITITYKIIFINCILYRKKEVDDLVMECLQEKQDGGKKKKKTASEESEDGEEEEEEGSEEEEEEEEKKPAKRNPAKKTPNKRKKGSSDDEESASDDDASDEEYSPKKPKVTPKKSKIFIFIIE